MDVNAIISQVAGLSTGDSEPDSAFQSTILGYLNNAHAEVYGKIAVKGRHLFSTTEDVTITSGSGTLSTSYLETRRVIDRTTKQMLTKRSVELIEDEDPLLENTGAPRNYWVENMSTIKTHPINSTTLKVRGIPGPNTLVLGGAESTIKVPPQYHMVLVWKTLFYLVFDERDKGFSVEASVASAKYSDMLSDLLEFIESLANDNLETAVYG